MHIFSSLPNNKMSTPKLQSRIRSFQKITITVKVIKLASFQHDQLCSLEKIVPSRYRKTV